MAPDLVCPRCGEPLLPGQPDCPYCTGRKRIPLHHREPVIIAAVVMVAVALWVATTFVTKAYAARQQQLARQWFERGDGDLRAQHLDAAVRELQSALAYSHDNFQYRLRLAEALAAQGHTRQAQGYLHALWDEDPANGTVNLELAQLAARSNDVAGALRFYHGAVYGIWQDDPAQRRREARFDLIEFLLAHRSPQQAQSELIALAADLPRDPALMLRVAGLMMKAGDYARALQGFREALALAPNHAAALAGAGEAAFSLQMYTEASGYLRRAIAEDTQDPQAAAHLQTAELVLLMDPYQRRLPASERERRIIDAFAQAGIRLQQCASARNIKLDQPLGNDPLATDYANWTALKPRVNPRSLRRNPEQGDAAMDLVFRIERDTEQVCGPGSAADLALLLIAQRREGTTP
ncbi:MAG: tetratricopeptide repeat protein [Acidobacteriia bacterium]|nr:tetratricopeptide repeat protein [Terriglobia bacterium]